MTPQSQYGIEIRRDESRRRDFEVDSTESVWYKIERTMKDIGEILKLTPQSQYGIDAGGVCQAASHFEVDSTESVWYSPRHHRARRELILKLTPQSQYGINVKTRGVFPPPF